MENENKSGKTSEIEKRNNKLGSLEKSWYYKVE